MQSLQNQPKLPVFAWVFCLLPVLASGEASKQCAIDEVKLPLSEEVWVESETARAIVTVEASADPAKSGALRGEVLALLRKLLPEEGGFQWRITSANLWRDPSGFERWQLQAEIRTAQSRLPGLQERAEKLSKPGLRFSLAIDWSPSLAEVESAKAKARKTLYARAVEEAARLNRALGERRYQVGDIEFRAPSAPHPEARVAKMEAVAAEEATLPRADRLVLQAFVVLRERRCERQAASP